MKKKYTKIKSIFPIQFVLVMSFLILFIGCKSIDNFDAFSLFDDENGSQGAGFRKYSQNLNQAPLVEFVMDRSDLESINLSNELKKTCEYTKIPFEIIELNKWDDAHIIRPSTRVVCMASTDKLSNKSIEKIFEFVANGGTLFIPYSSPDLRVSYFFGIKYDADYKTDVKTTGFRFTTPYLPGLKNVEVYKNVIHNGFAKHNFSENIKVFATGVSDSNFPVIIKNDIGAGQVIIINSRTSIQKRDRGLVFSAVLSGLEGIPYPIANTSTIFLDDFPSPLYNVKLEPIASEMDLTISDYVKKVWWPDMKRLAKKYNVSYSVMLTFDYKNKVVPPFTFDQWEINKIRYKNKIIPLSDYFVIDAAKNGHELAFHGYNHVEYLGDLWKNQEFVGMALNSVKKKWSFSNFGKLPVTYVPPSNYIDERGINKLKKEMPSLKYLCSSFNGETISGENREFDFDPYCKQFFDYPRTAYGFYITMDANYAQKSVFLYTGIWNHFLHPDDVFQIPLEKETKAGGNYDYDLRNPLALGWYKTGGKKNGLYYGWDRFLSDMKTNFPQIRFLNAGEGANIALDWRASVYKHSSKNGIYTVEEIDPELSLSNNQYWFLYVSDKNSKLIEKAFKNQVVRYSKTPFLEGFLYSIYTDKSKLDLPDLNYRNPDEENEMISTISKAKYDFKEFQKKVHNFHNGDGTWVDDSDIKFKKELDSLKQRMLTEVKIDSVAWNKYSMYMEWEDKGFEVWDLLDSHCQKYPLPENILYSIELSKTNDYPNDVIKEKWLWALIELIPNDKKTLTDYLNSFNSPEHKEKIKIILEHLLKVDDSFDIYLQYLQYLLLYEPAVAKVETDKIAPSEKYKSIAADICWLYADNKQLKKAYDWSFYSDEIDFSTKMGWLNELKEYSVLEKEYGKYIAKHDDYKAKAVMSEYLFSVGKFEEAWILANSLPNSPEKENLRAMLNKDVVYIDNKTQEFLINNYSEFFYPSVKSDLIKANRLARGNFLAYNTSLQSNKDRLSSFENLFSYNMYNKKGFLSSFAFTFSKMYNLKYEIDDSDNITHTVYGFQYQINSPLNDDNWRYWTKIRGEYSDFDNYYFQFGLGANISKGKRFTSVELKAFPVENGPSYSKSIYRVQTNLYHDTNLFKKVNTSLSIEGNYYTKSDRNSSVVTEYSFEGSITGKAIWDNAIVKKSKFLPFTELSYLRSSVGESTLDLSLGYPYWIIEERFYAGGGLGWKYTKKDLTAFTEASWFYDTYSNDFKRFIGVLTYQIFDYTALTCNFEMYSQAKFYSNALAIWN